jgi:hypothetical protein
LKTTLLLAMMAIGVAPLPAFAQFRLSGGAAQPTRPADGPRAGEGPRRPSPTVAPFRSTLHVRPAPAPHRLFPVRLPWFGLVFFDSDWWAPNGAGDTLSSSFAPPANDDRPAGGLQLDVEPRRASVYVDGRLTGIVESFSGYYRHLDLAAGWHTIELLATDYEPLLVEVMVSPGRTTTYRGSLSRARDRD